jgi:hypothetical protein
MKCHSCKAVVSDDAAVCPKCDAVLDASLFDLAPPDTNDESSNQTNERSPDQTFEGSALSGDDGEDARPVGRPKPKARRAATSPPKRASKAASTGGKAGKSRQDIANRETDPRSDWREEISEDDWKEMSRGKKDDFVPDRALEPSEMLEGIVLFVRTLSRPDQIGFFGQCAMALGCFFPWKDTAAHGESLGLLSSGIFVFFLAGGGLVALVARIRKLFGMTKPMVPMLGQIICVAFGTLSTVAYMFNAWDSTQVASTIGNYMTSVSKPSIGVFFSLAGGVVAALGSFMSLKDLSANSAPHED